ncbi:DoxX family protein [Halorientalis salina]|uniref:DoxX family protein n=1 Tax=Halorientalis salina TaxID=2932266 RepID=UPI0010AD2088|nr:DoxX family protein [Halorientalis salina]
MAITGAEGVALLVGRVLFGGVIAFTGLNHFMQTEEMTGYAEFKGLPAPKFGVLASGVLLVLGGVSIIAGVLPVVGAVVIAGFLVVSGVVFHDFWAVPAEDQQTEMTQFLKNVSLAGGALVIAAIGPQAWDYSLGISLF